MGITLVADRLSTMILFTSSVVLFSVIWYAISQGVRDGTKDEPVAVFLPTYMLLTMGVNISFLAGDLFNLYVGFEVFPRGLVRAVDLGGIGRPRARRRGLCDGLDGLIHDLPAGAGVCLCLRRHHEHGPDWPAHAGHPGGHPHRHLRHLARGLWH